MVAEKLPDSGSGCTIVKLDHVCIAVRKIEPARDKLCSLLGYSPRTEKVTNTRQQVVVQFLRKQGSIDLKLIEPSGPNSPLIDFVRKGGGLHHLCFRAENGQDAIRELSAKGARVIAEAQPGEAFDDNLIAFLFLGFGLNVEIIDTEDRRAELPKRDQCETRASEPGKTN